MTPTDRELLAVATPEQVMRYIEATMMNSIRTAFFDLAVQNYEAQIEAYKATKHAEMQRKHYQDVRSMQEKIYRDK